jgi:Phosphoesterase family
MADDPIEHVVLLMLENRSFDHILGGTQKMLARWSLSGTNQYNGNTFPQMSGAARQVAQRSRARDDGRPDSGGCQWQRSAKRRLRPELRAALSATRGPFGGHALSQRRNIARTARARQRIYSLRGLALIRARTHLG